MPVVGHRENKRPGNGFENDRMRSFAASYMNAVKSIVTESAVDAISDPTRAFANNGALSTLKDFFIQESYDKGFYEATNNPAGLDDHIDSMNALFDNDLEAVREYAAMVNYNPVVGMTFPIHKYILMNCMFDKCIPHSVAVTPKFTISTERCYMVTPEGEQIDMWKNQNEMYSAMVNTNPLKTTIINLPEMETTDILSTVHGRTGTSDNLSIESYISAVQVPMYLKTGDINPETGVAAVADGSVDVWIPVDGRFTPGYGENDRQLSFSVRYETRDVTDPTKNVEKKDLVTGYMKNNKFVISSASGSAIVKKVKLTTRVDPSNAMLATCSVTWRVNTEIVEIPNATPINVPISPEEIKDLQALYQVNQVTKVMSLINTVLGNYKDDSIKKSLDDSFLKLPAEQKFTGTFDFAPREGYYGDHIQWRSATFMDALETYVQQMLQVWNDPNVTITVVGRAELIRKITPQEYTYQSPASIGPVDLDYVQTVVTSSRRVYTFMSSDKMRDNNNLIIILNPRNTDRIMYEVFDYQAYVSNEIRNALNPALPAVHAFERFKFFELFSVQSRVRILNPTGLRTQVANNDPIGKTAMNDFTANAPESVAP